MLKKIFFIILLFNLFNHCEYRPVYSNQNKIDYKIIITNFSGDKGINNLIKRNIDRKSKKNSNQIVSISFDTKYTKNILAKNTTGAITDYQINVDTIFLIENENNTKSFTINEKFNFKKMTDKYEEKNYEQNIKRNIANSISQKLILRLAMTK